MSANEPLVANDAPVVGSNCAATYKHVERASQ
jgi:hypothetical protein